MKMELRNCSQCAAEPGEPHRGVCGVERCSVCGGQRYGCGCDGHDRIFARWTGIYPGYAEARYLGIDMNELYASGRFQKLFVKPEPDGGSPPEKEDTDSAEVMDAALDEVNRFRKLYLNSQILICLLLEALGGEFRTALTGAKPDVTKLRIYQDFATLEIVMTTRPAEVEANSEPSTADE